MVQFNAHYDGNVIKPDEPVDLPVGQQLRVTIDPASQPQATQSAWQRLGTLADQFAIDGPADLADNHDKYAHGKP